MNNKPTLVERQALLREVPQRSFWSSTNKFLGKTVGLLVAAVSLLPWLAAAQQAEEVSVAFRCEGTTSSKAERSTLKRVQKAYEGIESFSAEFRQSSYLSALDIAEESGGKVWFTNPGKMKWQYAYPEEQDFVVVEDTYWYYQPENEQVTIDSFERVALGDLPIAFLMGIGDLERQFELTESCRSSKGTVLTLVPRQEEAKEATTPSGTADEIKSFSLLIATDSSYPLGAKVTHLGGNSTEVVFGELALDSSHSTDTYKVEWPDGFDVIDRR